MDNQQDQSASDPGKSIITAENGSAAMSKEQTEKKAEDGKNCSQLHKWVYQTSQGDLTFSENLEKSKWEGNFHNCVNKTENDSSQNKCTG
jgi:hypothetical protein